MYIYCDSNQKIGKHLNKERYFIQQGYTIIRQRLKVGDYMLDLNGKVSVDTKQDIAEICTNLFNKEDNKRFIRECVRAKKNKIKLLFLIEQKIDSVTGIVLGNSKRKIIVNRQQIFDKIKYFEKMYGVRFIFCQKDCAGAKIIELLTQFE